MAKVVPVHDAGEAGHKQLSAAAHVFPQPLGEPVPEHEGLGQHHQAVIRKVGVGIPHVGADAHLEQGPVMVPRGPDGVHMIPEAGLDEGGGPAALLVQDDERLRLFHGLFFEGGDLFQRFAGKHRVPEHPGVVPAVVPDHRAVEGLAAAPALAPLEIHHAVAAAEHRKQRGGQLHARALQLVDGMPVHLGGAGLHQKEGASLQGAHIVVVHAGLGHLRQVIPGPQAGIAVPGDQVRFLCEDTVIVVPEGPHHIHRDGLVRAVGPDGLFFIADEGGALIGGKTPPVQPHGGVGHFAQGGGRVDLLKGGILLAPEGGPPAAVQLLHGAVFVFKPAPEGGGAQRAIAVPAEFVADVPHDHPGMAPEALAQLHIDFPHLAAVVGAGQAVVVPFAEKAPAPLFVGAQHGGVFFGEPRGARAGGGGQVGIDSVVVQAADDVLQPGEIIFPVPLFKGAPCEDAQRNAVHVGFFHHFQVRLQNIRAVQPLVRVIVPAVEEKGKIVRYGHKCSSLYCICRASWGTKPLTGMPPTRVST